MIWPTDIIETLRRLRFNLDNEVATQTEISVILERQFSTELVVREYHLDAKNIIDFLIDGRIGIEVKLKGAKRQIFRQCERYCSFDKIKVLILVTNITMGFPETINGKPCYVIKLGQAWL